MLITLSQFMNDNFYLKITVIFSAVCLLGWLFKTPKYKNYILPTWEKPNAMCKDEYFTWEWNNDMCKRHGGIRYIFE